MNLLKTVIIIFVFACACILYSCASPETSPEASIESNPNYAFANLDPATKYVGDQECAVCHSDIYETYKQTGMGRSFYLPTPENIIEDYEDQNRIHDPKSNYYYEMQQREGGFYQVEYRLNKSGERIHELSRKVDYIIGSGNKARTYLTNENGFLYELPVTWFTEKAAWGLSPGYQVQNRRFSRTVIEGCMNCHNSYSGFEAYSGNRFLDVQHGIGCERCHGPGQDHIDKRFSKVNYGNLESDEIDSSIVNPKHLPVVKQMDVCRQCHLQGKFRILKAGKKDTDFRPGMTLSDVKSVFIEDPLPRGDFSVASHGARFSLSDCFTKSNGRLTCTTCHNPHEPVQWRSREMFNGICINCHAIEALSPTSAIASHRSTDDCISCHMSQGSTSDVVHVNFTDHWIRKDSRPKSDGQEAAKSQEKEMVLREFYEGAGGNADIRMGIAYLNYAEANGNKSSAMNKAVELLNAGLENDPENRDGLLNLSSAYVHLNQDTEAIPLLQKLTENYPDDATAWFALGNILHKTSQLEQAMETYQKSLAIFSKNPIALTNLGNIHAQLERPKAAVDAFRKALRIQEAYLPAHNSLGELYLLTRQDPRTARHHFQNAQKFDPDDFRSLYNLGITDLAEGNPKTAKRYFERVIALNPAFIPAYGSLARIHAQSGEKERAITYLQKILQINPTDQQAQQMLQQLQ